jgi:hypothetical protein
VNESEPDRPAPEPPYEPRPDEKPGPHSPEPDRPAPEPPYEPEPDEKPGPHSPEPAE